ncbi:MAG: Flagellar P-ring protein [Syntrophus sp. SKADARSKE-3]|nr:Flagellar P-ring protein [Syntrophus sp. SKADARSKE-3]
MKRIGKIDIILAAILCVMMVLPASAHSARIKDIASISGVRDNQLIGYGLVVGLAGTGDNIKNGFTSESISNMLSRQGLAMKDKVLKSNNAAAVMITASLPPFAKIGSKIDIVVSSLGDAKSLQGGTLLMTPLRGADGEIYAVAQGNIVLGGYLATGAAGTNTVNHPSVGRIAGGAFVEKELKYAFDKLRSFTVNLNQPDFTTASRLLTVISKTVTVADAELIDSSSVIVRVREPFNGNIVQLVSVVENLDCPVDSVAVVVMNEKTGTVVMGENVRIATVAVSHGNLSIQIRDESDVSQPLPFSPRPPRGKRPITGQEGTIVAPGGQTVVTKETTITEEETKRQLMLVPRGVTIKDVVKGLNAMGISPRDLITIMQTIKAAGALQADLKII